MDKVLGARLAEDDPESKSLQVYQIPFKILESIKVLNFLGWAFKLKYNRSYLFLFLHF